MSLAAQIVAAVVVGALFLVRLAFALHSDHEDSQVAARHSTQDGQR